MQVTASDLPRLAHRIATAIRVGNVDSLRTDLETAACAADNCSGWPAETAERLELLGAVASDLRRSIKRDGAPSFGAEWKANLELLEHLEREAPAYGSSSNMAASSRLISAKMSAGG